MLDTGSSLSSSQPLHNAWVLRWNQRIEEAMLAMAQIQTTQQWAHLEVQDLGLQKSMSEKELYLEALLLKGALWRAQGQEKKSSAWLRRILSRCEDLQMPLIFRLLFELGLDCWRQEDVAQALDYFLLAERKSRNIIEQVFTQSNVLWCLESLDLDRKQFELKIEDSLARVPADQAAEVSHVLEQWRAYKMRKDFYQNLTLQTASEDGQGVFFEKWVQALPYAPNSTDSVFDLNSSYLWQGSYRLRTLAGIWSPADKTCLRVGDGIDRLYLWVWKWMAGQDTSKEKIFWTLDSILEQLDIAELSKENGLLLRNALSWLAVVDGAFAKRHHKMLLRLQSLTSTNYPVLNTEFALICCLSQKDSEDLIPSLQQFPVFAKIFRQSSNKKGSPLLPRLKNVLEEKSKLKDSDHDLVINCQTNEIYFTDLDKTVRSKKLLGLLQHLNEHSKMALADIPNESDDPRFIYNLLGRLRKLLSASAFKVENGFFIKSKTWPRIQFIHQNALELSVSDYSDVHYLKVPMVGSESYLQAAKALLAKPFLRKDLEKALKISKATACRMLEDWLEQGLLAKSGQARATMYHWRKDV